MIERKEFGADDYEYQHVRAQIATFEAERLAKEGFKFFSQETYRNAAYLEEKAFNLAPNVSAKDVDWRIHFAQNSLNWFKKAKDREGSRRMTQAIRSIKL